MVHVGIYTGWSESLVGTLFLATTCVHCFGLYVGNSYDIGFFENLISDKITK